MPRKEREFQRHRQEILLASEAVFSEKGYVSATMEEIAQRAEFAVGTLYKFFENKADLYAETVLTRTEDMESEVYSSLESETMPGDQIRAYFHCRIGLFWEYPRFFRLFFQGPIGTICDANLGYLPSILERYKKLLGRLNQTFEAGIKSGEFRDLDTNMITLSLEGLLRAYVEGLSRLENPVRDPKEESQLLDLFLSGAAR
jgi:AcrR family transcriptional regulator